MSASKSGESTDLFTVVANIQEQMEDSGYSSEVVDAIVARGLAILFGYQLEDGERPKRYSQLSSSSI